MPAQGPFCRDPLDLVDALDPVDPLETLAWEKVVFRLSKTMYFPVKTQQNAWSVTRFHAFSNKSVTLRAFFIICT